MRLAHIHIPRTGGNALRSAYEKAHPGRRVLRINDPDKVPELEGIGPTQFDFLQCHLPWVMWPSGIEGFRVVTTVRDPLERLLSMYSLIVNHPKLTESATAQRVRDEGMSLRDFAGSEDGDVLSRTHSLQVYLGHGEDPVHTACQTLDRLDWVASENRFGALLYALGLPYPGRHNQLAPSKRYRPSEPEIAACEERLGGERDVYRYARAVEDRRIALGLRLDPEPIGATP